jgi:hypothetical protein
MNGNVEQLKQFPPILARVGVRHYIVQSLLDWAPNRINADLNANELAYSAIEELKANAAESGVHLQLMTPERISVETGPERQGLNVFFGDAHANNAIESRSRVCMLPWESAHIDASGSVFPCCSASAKNEGKLGDLTKTSLDEIWNGPAYSETCSLTSGSRKSSTKDAIQNLSEPSW